MKGFYKFIFPLLLLFITGGSFWAAFMGFLIGSFIDNLSVRVQTGNSNYSSGGNPYSDSNSQFFRPRISQDDFALGLIILSASVMKADGKVVKSELSYVKKFLLQQFGEYKAGIHLQRLREVLNKNYSLEQVCGDIKMVMAPEVRLQLLHYLFGIALADGSVSQSELDVIQRISDGLGLGRREFESIKAMFYKDPISAYKILEIDQDATDAEVKKAYRKMAVKYHPDKIAQMGEEFQKGAKEKFQKVQEAYDIIKKERGFK
ncbi:MAG: TerB family tellurite resistance protein [Crocinitomicaceae bacterium]|nr:TerB family tellurite resistance protein [Crocinitomicaceae bacterium]